MTVEVVVESKVVENEKKGVDESIIDTSVVSDEKKAIIEEEASAVAAAAKEGEKEALKDGKEKNNDKEKEAKKEKEVKEKEAPVPPPPKVHKQDFEKDVVYLFQFSRTPQLPSISPFCLKVESFLRLTGLNYRNVDHKTKFKSAKGQLPFIELNGEEIADSSYIMSRLTSHFGVDPDAALTKEEKNASHALSSMIENHLCWVIMAWRSKNPDSFIKGFKLNFQHALGSRIPNPVLSWIFKMTYLRKGAKKVKAHGLGLYSPEEIFAFGKQDLQVLEDTIGTKNFFFGDSPSNLDVVAFAHLSQIYYIEKDVVYELRDWLSANCPHLVSFLTRMRERIFPDWDTLTTTLKLNTHVEEEEVEEEKKPKEEEEVGEKDEKADEKEPLVEKEETKEAAKEEAKKEEEK